jgi:hypothetical protein
MGQFDVVAVDNEDEQNNSSAESTQNDKPAKKAKSKKAKPADDKEKPPTGDKASHYLVLADGQTVGFSVGDDPTTPFPSEHDGVAVVQVRNAR